MFPSPTDRRVFFSSRVTRALITKRFFSGATLALGMRSR